MNCKEGQEGYIKRKCKLGKVWGPIENNCKPKGIKCPADSGFPETDPGKMSVIKCDDGSNAKRYCTMDSKWSSIQSPCRSENNEEDIIRYLRKALRKIIRKILDFFVKFFISQNS